MRLVSVALSIILLSISLAASQTIYPPTIRVPVTFYDFHSDGSNPDFEPGLYTCGTTGCYSSSGVHLNEVQAVLDAQGKPVLGTSPYFSNRVGKWFRPWQPGDSTAPLYTAAGVYLRDTTLPSDTAYKNMVFQDSLTFTLVPGSSGVYQLNNQAFFVLDGRGFGADDPGGQNPPHNFGFTMEMHWEFTFQSGLTFSFAGDDDIWVFINGQRVIDLGGIHGPVTASVNLDNLTGMTLGQRYTLDVFYVERKTVGSDILVTTNIVTACPCLWELRLTPRVDTVAAGDSLVLRAEVVDDTLGNHPDISSMCDWTLHPAGTASSLRTPHGESNTFYADAADQTCTIVARYNGPPLQINAEFRSVDSMKVFVKPATSSIRRHAVLASRVLEKIGPFREYYNLRGQKMRSLDRCRVDGIVFERVIGLGGTASVKRKFKYVDSKQEISE